MLFVGDDWAEDHHDVEIVDEAGRRLARRRLPEGAAGVSDLHALLADRLDEDAGPEQVVVGIETERGPWVRALRAAGYEVFAVNPMQVARYRERHSTSGTKSDRADAHVLAELVRLDRDHHRPVAEDSADAEAVKVLARAHQNLVWQRQRQLNQLRSTLREFYPAALAAFGSDLGSRDALAVLAAAPTPQTGRALNTRGVAEILREAGRKRNLTTRGEAITRALGQHQLEQPQVLADAYGASVRSLVAVITELTRQTEQLETEVSRCFGRHPDAEIYRSQPGLGPVLGARALAEFGDAAGRYTDAKAARTTPEPPPSPAPPARKPWSPPASPATGAWPTCATCKHSPR